LIVFLLKILIFFYKKRNKMTYKSKGFILFFFILIVLLSYNKVYSQYTPPTLSGGIDNLVYSKGNIDVELLSALIISKQEELKKETIKRFILSDFDAGSSLLFYDFISQILNVVLHQNNKQIISKEITERVVNLAMVYSFIEFYLQVQWKIPEKRDLAFVEMIKFCSKRPQYLSMNEQAVWQKMFNERIAGEPKNILFHLKSFNPEDFVNEIEQIEAITNEVNTDFKPLEFIFISEELQKLNARLFSFQQNNTDYFADRNIEVKEISNNFIFKKAIEDLKKGTKLYTQNTGIILDKLSVFQKNIVKVAQDNYKGKNLKELAVFTQSNSKIDSLIGFVRGLHSLEQQSNTEIYKLLYNRLLSNKTPTIKNTTLFTKFHQAFTDFKASNKSNSDSNLVKVDTLQNIHKLYKKVFAEMIEANILSWQNNELNELSSSILFSQYLSEIGKSNYQSLFQELLNEDNFTSKINYGNAYIENEYSIVQKYNDLIDRNKNLEHSFNQEFLTKKFLKLIKSFNNTEAIQNNDLLYTLFNQKLRDNEINEYQLLYDGLDKYLKTKYPYEESYFDEIEVEENYKLLDEIVSDTTNYYEEVENIFDIMNLVNGDSTIKEKLLSDEFMETFENIGLEKSYTSVKEMLKTHDTLKIDHRISQLKQIENNLDFITQIENYNILPPSVQEAYRDFSYRITERKQKEEVTLNFKNTPEYKNFTAELVKWKITQEQKAILVHIEQLKADGVDFYSIKEYQRLNTEWNLYFLSTQLEDFTNQLRQNTSTTDEINRFIELKTLPTYKAFMENVDKYQFILNEDSTYNNLSKNKSLIENLPIHLLDFKSKEFLLNYTDWLLFQIQVSELNRIKRILELFLKQENQIIPLNMILLDMVYDISYNNKVIQKTGFFNQSKEMDNDKFNKANTFLSIKNQDPEFFQHLTNLRKTMEKEMEMFFNFYQLIQELDYFKGKNLDEIRNNYIEQIKISMSDTTKLKKYNNSQPFIETANKISCVEEVFCKTNKQFEIIQKEINQIQNIQERIVFFNKNLKIKKETKSSPNDDESNEKRNSSPNDDELEELKLKIPYVSTKNIVNRADTISNLLENMPEDFKIYDYQKKLEKIIERLNQKEIHNYSESYSIDNKRFIDYYQSLNDTILNIISQFKTLHDKYKRDILSNLLSKNDYIGFNLAIFKQSINDFYANELAAQDKEVLIQVYSYISNLEKPGNNNINFEFINHLRSKIIPQLVAINIKYKPINQFQNNKLEQIPYPVIKNMISVESLENILNYAYFMNINSFYDPDNIISPEIVKLSTQFIDLVSRLNRLDEVETYQLFFNTLNDIGNIFPKNKTINSFNTFTNSILKHTILNTEENTINFDAESFLLLFYEQYKNISINNWSLYFSIGLNQASFFKNVNLTASDTNQYTIKNLAFASEKIGIKYTLLNFNEKIMLKQQKELKKYYTSKPIVSDWHLIAYGSGLLYNIVNTTTDKNHFNLPMIGIGTGLTFYNSLDINLFYNVPFTENAFNKSMFGFSFDIKIGEYVSELNKQRKLQKTKNRQ